jgi:hypothetical protein
MEKGLVATPVQCGRKYQDIVKKTKVSLLFIACCFIVLFFLLQKAIRTESKQTGSGRVDLNPAQKMADDAIGGAANPTISPPSIASSESSELSATATREKSKRPLERVADSIEERTKMQAAFYQCMAKTFVMSCQSIMGQNPESASMLQPYSFSSSSSISSSSSSISSSSSPSSIYSSSLQQSVMSLCNDVLVVLYVTVEEKVPFYFTTFWRIRSSSRASRLVFSSSKEEKDTFAL